MDIKLNYTSLNKIKPAFYVSIKLIKLFFRIQCKTFQIIKRKFIYFFLKNLTYVMPSTQIPHKNKQKFWGIIFLIF